MGVFKEEAVEYGSDNRDAVYSMATNFSKQEATGSTITADKMEQALSDVQVRTADIKTAFWNPMLVTDERGNANIEFDVPNLNTTWLFQAIGYNKDMNTATLLKEVVSNKPIMVKSNMPRFIRQSDKAILFAVMALTGMIFSPVGEELFF